MGFSAHFFISGSDGGIIGSLLDVALRDLVLGDQRRQEVRHTLIGEFGKRSAFALNVLDRLGGVCGHEEGKKFSLESFILYLRRSGLPRRRSLLVKKGDLMVQPVGKHSLVFVGEIREGNKRGEGNKHFALSHGRFSF